MTLLTSSSHRQCDALPSLATTQTRTIGKAFDAEPVSRKRVYPPIETETRTLVDTGCAAFHLLREEQTLRIWACKGSGPLQPVRIHGRLAWRVADLKRILGGAQ